MEVKHRNTGNVIYLESVPNFRAVSFTTSENGSKNKLFRSSRPDLITEEDFSKFQDLGFKSIIDLRSPSEYKSQPTACLLDTVFPIYRATLPSRQFRCGDDVQYKKVKAAGLVPEDQTTNKHYFINFFPFSSFNRVARHLPLYVRLYLIVLAIFDLIFKTAYFVKKFFGGMVYKKGLGGLYIFIVENSQNSIYAALKLLCDNNNIPALINCAHGKDRTGVVSALIQELMGCSRDEVTREYAMSEGELDRVHERILREICEKFDEVSEFMKSRPETMMQLLDHIDNKYGSVTNYLNHIGFGPEDQRQLIENLSS